MSEHGLFLDCQITEYGDGIADEIYDQLGEITADAQMIALTPEVIQSHQRNMVVMSGERLVGYAALTGSYVYSDGEQQYPAIELGGAVVMPDFRRMGVASFLLKQRVKLMSEDPHYSDTTRAVVFTNHTSRPYVTKAGFRPLADNESLDVSAFELCKGCNDCPTKGPKPWEDPRTCCDFEGIRIAIPSELHNRAQGVNLIKPTLAGMAVDLSGIRPGHS